MHWHGIIHLHIKWLQCLRHAVECTCVKQTHTKTRGCNNNKILLLKHLSSGIRPETRHQWNCVLIEFSFEFDAWICNRWANACRALDWYFWVDTNVLNEFRQNIEIYTNKNLIGFVDVQVAMMPSALDGGCRKNLNQWSISLEFFELASRFSWNGDFQPFWITLNAILDRYSIVFPPYFTQRWSHFVRKKLVKTQVARVPGCPIMVFSCSRCLIVAVLSISDVKVGKLISKSVFFC